MPYFFDTYALFEIINKNENYSKYFEEEIITSNLNLAELFYGFLKENKSGLIDEWKDKVKLLIDKIELVVIIDSVKFKHKHKNKSFSFIDCLGYNIAKSLNIPFLTGDKEFKGLDNVEFVGST
ncbi:MAG: PIN domain-containing protein [Candidatus Woesearchaeota archaeon]|jgi:predicted nucleic acid-binding protein|nr:PIN domain-containing protein [Candidatus Woesearchaeota archaeon]MDP7457683.1 PIN domain-containing protein [Candidatus Woesearchaeota archaeon]|tara:strand:+ start:409 stop:777 length:369 start_codon:yes stop_codon:yes gene_type:complete